MVSDTGILVNKLSISKKNMNGIRNILKGRIKGVGAIYIIIISSKRREN